MREKPAELQRITYEISARDIATDVELASFQRGSDVIFDTEIYENYFLAAFKHIATQKYFYVELSPDCQLNIEKLAWIMWRFRLFGFYSKPFDIPVINAALNGATASQLMQIVNKLINEEQFGSKRSPYNDIDLKEVCPLQGSLKLYAARLHAKRIQELPFAPGKMLSSAEAEIVRDYCFNDLDATEIVKNGLADQLKLRYELSDKYKVDWCSKSDAQLAEAIIAAELPIRVNKVHFTKWHQKFGYIPPSYVRFKTKLLQDLLEHLCSINFETSPITGRVENNAIDIALTIADKTYHMGLGGLHSTESSVGLTSNAERQLIDYDVASFYPHIILNGGIEPEQMKGYFLAVYKNIVERRLELKKLKDPMADGLKIATNGTFGKLGEPHSIVYAPNLMLYVCLTGQLSLLMIAEAAAIAGFTVVSANTDGMLFDCPHRRLVELKDLMAAWSVATGYPLEATQYRSYYARDVNNYIAIKNDGTVKQKGTYSERGSALNSPLSRNPEALICIDALVALFSKQIPIENTIRACNDVRRFVMVRNVKGGAHKNGLYLGKVVRWYYAKGETDEINYIDSGAKVSNSLGARPLMELPLGLPDDLDFAYYERKAHEMLTNIGYNARPKFASLWAQTLGLVTK